MESLAHNNDAERQELGVCGTQMRYTPQLDEPTQS